MVHLNIRMLLISLLILFEVSAQGQWMLDRKEDGIEVYTRNERGSDFKSFKAIAFVEASTIEIIKILRDADSYTKWYGFTKTSKLLEQHGDEQYNYVETIFPWPFKNRDMVYKMSISTSNPDSTTIHLLGIPDYIPEKNGLVRMQKAEGYMSLKQIANMTEITYQFHSEPGDNVPVWLANNSISELPFRTLSGLKAMLKENRTGR